MTTTMTMYALPARWRALGAAARERGSQTEAGAFEMAAVELEVHLFPQAATGLNHAALEARRAAGHPHA